ncbi:d-isomer-specific 2-hydroxyacid dehydrogenase family protein [Diplodia corticola]|uniref:D-isomer-specific 2-hydroxyacid dehydrogenase family protein n=1 Tax=Diplodia corticola TaxID=236234 RepID=A0A1J9S223_9PEZI|nr:d-isomer-specific 2-hydroxyacid dehydrogenase family protein [Diplodia corticola]OJD34060.1 d-isomer-specific 2-hydroxyacid dehydrogenase family protein [Diplodia corticola]
MASTTPQPIKMAILDDYQNLSAPYFANFHPTELQIDTFPDTLPPSATDALIARLKPYTIISTMRQRTPFPAPLIASLPNLRLLLTTGLRNNSLDLPAFAAASIPVAGTPSDIPTAPSPTSTPPPLRTGFSKTTQHTWALILALTSNIPRDDHNLKLTSSPSPWQSSPPLNTFLADRTFAVLGLGKLGVAAARTAILGFGMRVVAWSASLTQDGADALAVAAGLWAGAFECVDTKEEACRRADVLSLHYVLSGRSAGMVGRKELGCMKRGAVLVNTARAGLVDEEALWECLVGGRIAGAALDVWWEEPMGEGSRWRREPWGEGGRGRLVGTPHMGYMFEETLDLWWRETAANVRRWLDGEELAHRLV